MYKLKLKILLISLMSLNTPSKAMELSEEDYVKVHVWRPSTYSYVPDSVASYVASTLTSFVLTDPGHTSLEIHSLQKKYISRPDPNKDIETYEQDVQDRRKVPDKSFVLFSLKNSSICDYTKNSNEYGSTLVLKALKAGGIEKLFHNSNNFSLNNYFDITKNYLYYGGRPLLWIAGGIAAPYFIGGFTVEACFYTLGLSDFASNYKHLSSAYQADLSDYDVTPDRIIRLLTKAQELERKQDTRTVEWEANLVKNDTIVNCFLSEAMKGNLDAQLALGIDHSFGHWGLLKSEKEAVKWFRLAAEKEHAVAQTCVGECYLKGMGVPKDEKEAVKWFRLAASKHYPIAQACLGWCYLKGIGAPKDEKEAETWYKLATGKEFLPTDEKAIQECVEKLAIPALNQFTTARQKIMKKAISSLMISPGNRPIDVQPFTVGVNNSIERVQNSSQTPQDNIFTNLQHFVVGLAQEEDQHDLVAKNHHFAFGGQ